ncbi:MAG: phosphoribosylformylglycinamidine synthase [Treponema sp.]|nr:phosphoribosylformylglycinamidine synthase [Treponema sp.]
MSVYEIYVEKKPEFADETLASDLRLGLQMDNIKSVRIINRYFTEGISAEDFEAAKNTVFSEPVVDNIYEKLPSFNDARVFAMEYLPGQFDQKAEICAQCISLAAAIEKPVVNTARIIAVYGDLTDNDFSRIKSWLINPVESREISLEKPSTLIQKYPKPGDVEIMDGFISLCADGLKDFLANMNLAMDLSDLQFCQKYFRDEEKRDPTFTEIRVLDTYWSDHCRHTTFLTELNEIQIEDDIIRESYNNYLALRAELKRSDKPVTMMDMATIGARALKERGLLNNLDESEEINACSVKIKVEVNGKDTDWYLMFKNETHNHPTEIEPFGGAATCLGGAIRDPLSGRAHVYQAMRITGAGDPLLSSTLPGKLPQRKLCRTAAAGYSSYGNQIGLTAGLVQEIYHPGFTAKRMELGALIAAVPCENVVRQRPDAGDVVILLGGRTGRDGIGGATGSSKSHNESSFITCSADVQKGNAIEERKIVRLFRNPSASRLIKKCNDFGAGGVSVSVGELADGLLIDLNKVSVKYEGLDGTELAISESQERMSIVTAKKDADKFISLAAQENLEAFVIAEVTQEPRLVMNWNGKTIVNLSRSFLNSNGACKFAKAAVTNGLSGIKQDIVNKEFNFEELKAFAKSLNICSQKGLADGFDSSIGAGTVVAPYGGKHQITPSQSMVAKIPVLEGDTKTCSIMSWGYDPEVSSLSPYHGAVFAVVHSIAKVIASGGSRKNVYLTFQEYFEKLRDDPLRWGKPFAALLGALDAQLGLQAASIGGKDSMSGTYENIDVPPTLVSFAVAPSKTDNIITPEFKKADSLVYLLKPPKGDKYDFKALCEYFDNIEKLIADKKIISAWALGSGGTAEAIIKMCVGNRLGFAAEGELSCGFGFGGFVVETVEQISRRDAELLGRTTEQYILKTKSYEVFFHKLQAAWEGTLEPLYPRLVIQDSKTEDFTANQHEPTRTNTLNSSSRSCGSLSKNQKTKFLIPVFYGSNSEYDSARAIEKAGGEAITFIIKTATPKDIKESEKEFVSILGKSQVLYLCGGACGTDEPSGYGRFISAFLRKKEISDSVTELLQKRDGLIYGVASGFQALLKLGLLPYGQIQENNEVSLTFNSIGRHQCMLVNTKIVSNMSPWLSHLKTGSRYIVPVSCGEGRFIAQENFIRSLAFKGQIATQYVDFEGNASQDIRYNPANSDFSVEGITSPDGRIFGRMAHNERYEEGLYKNIPGISKMDIFAGALGYFK